MRSLAFYCYLSNPLCIDAPTRLALDCLKLYKDIFDGQKVVFIGTDHPNSIDRSNASRLFDFLEGVEIEFVKNEPNTRESQCFMDLMHRLETSQLVFYAHNKGSTHPMDEGLMHWIHMMYFFNLSKDVLPSIEKALSDHVVSGVFRKNARCDAHGLSVNWHYSGAFFWFNMQKLTAIDGWDNISRHRMGLEFYPGSIISIGDSHCSFGEKNHNFDMVLDTFMSMLVSNVHRDAYLTNTDMIWKK